MPIIRRKTVRLRALVPLLAAVFAACVAYAPETAKRSQAPSPADVAANPHLAFGDPSGAAAGDPNNFLLIGEGYALSYNNSLGTANWVSWRTRRADLGPAIPRPEFRPDDRLPPDFVRVTPQDYSGSGYDRGHLVPSADRFADPYLNQETFLMSNIVPQTRSLNKYPWNRFEAHARGQTRRGFDVYQIAGVYGASGVLKGRVTAPAGCWKVIMLIPAGMPHTAIDERTQIYAVDMPNVDGLENRSWEEFRTTIRAIEERTGLDLFAHLPRELQDVLEKKR
jgi:endonuclease G, mitochondrial